MKAWIIKYKEEENNNVLLRYEHVLEIVLEEIEHQSKEKKEEKEKKMKYKNHYSSTVVSKGNPEYKMKDKEPLQCWTVNTISSTNKFYY